MPVRAYIGMLNQLSLHFVLKRANREHQSIIFCIFLIFLLQVSMIFGRAIDWDSFWHFHLAYLLREGRLYTPLQTYFIRVFSWATLLPGTAVDQLIIVRIFMLIFELIAALAIAALASRFTDRTIGLLAALAYLSAGFVMQHGFSFRADPGLAALGMSALWILSCTPFRRLWIVLFAVLLAIAAMFSIKIILYTPAFAGIAWLRWSEDSFHRRFLFRLAIASALTAGLFVLLFLHHSHSGASVDTNAQTVLSRSAEKMFFIGIPPYWIMAIKFVALSVPLSLIMLIFPLALQRSNLSSAGKLAILGMFLPLITLAFYHNTAPYYYVFMMAPVAVACSLPIQFAVRRYGATFLAIPLTVSGVLVWNSEDFSVIDRQREIFEVSKEILPSNVSYFDFCGMLVGHDKANIFMTPFMMNFYRRGGTSSLAETMQTKIVPLVVENDPMFTRLLWTNGPSPEFLSTDAAALRDTYVHFWGPFWLAGKEIPKGTRNLSSQFRVPGAYIVRGGPILLDGVRFDPGAAVYIERGMHELSALEGDALLRWGKDVREPKIAPPSGPLWVYF